MRKSEGLAVDDSTSYFTYRPLSNLPTPPPTARQPRSTTASYANDDGEALPAIYRGRSIGFLSPCLRLRGSVILLVHAVARPILAIAHIHTYTCLHHRAGNPSCQSDSLDRVCRLRLGPSGPVHPQSGQPTPRNDCAGSLRSRPPRRELRSQMAAHMPSTSWPQRASGGEGST